LELIVAVPKPEVGRYRTKSVGVNSNAEVLLTPVMAVHVVPLSVE